jgi:hypothetical protein
MAKLHWNEATIDQKLEYLLRAVKDSQRPLPNQFLNDADNLIRDKEMKELREELATERRKRKEFETYKEENDGRIKKIMAHANKMAEQMAALKKMIENQASV